MRIIYITTTYDCCRSQHIVRQKAFDTSLKPAFAYCDPEEVEPLWEVTDITFFFKYVTLHNNPRQRASLLT